MKELLDAELAMFEQAAGGLPDPPYVVPAYDVFGKGARTVDKFGVPVSSRDASRTEGSGDVIQTGGARRRQRRATKRRGRGKGRYSLNLRLRVSSRQRQRQSRRNRS